MQIQPPAEPQSREVTIDDRLYRITLDPAVQRDGTRFAVVEAPSEWRVQVPLPTGVQDLEALWYRELVELVEHATTLMLDSRMSA